MTMGENVNVKFSDVAQLSEEKRNWKEWLIS